MGFHAVSRPSAACAVSIIGLRQQVCVGIDARDRAADKLTMERGLVNFEIL